MTVFFIIISLLLNILLIFAVVLLYMRQNKIFGMEDTQKRTLKEMEELISTYLIEMKEENEQFINRVKEINLKTTKNYSNDAFVISNDAHHTSVELDEKQEDPLSNRLGKTVSLHAVKAYEKQKQKTEQSIIGISPVASVVDKQNLKETVKLKKVEDSNKIPNESLLDQILTLKEKGLTEEELAKKFNKGKTEIELLLKFQEKR